MSKPVKNGTRSAKLLRAQVENQQETIEIQDQIIGERGKTLLHLDSFFRMWLHQLPAVYATNVWRELRKHAVGDKQDKCVREAIEDIDNIIKEMEE